MKFHVIKETSFIITRECKKYKEYSKRGQPTKQEKKRKAQPNNLKTKKKGDVYTTLNNLEGIYPTNNKNKQHK
jgi:hypothetical protein